MKLHSLIVVLALLLLATGCTFQLVEMAGESSPGAPATTGDGETVTPSDRVEETGAAAGVDGVLGHEGPAGLAGAVLEEVLEGGADGGLVGDAEVGEPVEGGVVGFDGFVGGFEVEGGHS